MGEGRRGLAGRGGEERRRGGGGAKGCCIQQAAELVANLAACRLSEEESVRTGSLPVTVWRSAFTQQHGVWRGSQQQAPKCCQR